MDTHKEIIKENKEIVPCLLKESVHKNCSIFRAPPLLFQSNPRAFKPLIVSIGPIHNKDGDRLQMIEQHKPRFVEFFLETANRNGGSMTMTSLENIVKNLEKDIRDSYSEPLQLSSEELVKMMVLDGCFFLMLISVMSFNAKLTNPNDTIFILPWIVLILRSDLLLLENELPYFLLERLFAKLGYPGYVDLKRTICIFFESSLGNMSERVLENTEKIEPRHLLHLIREILIPESGYKSQGKSSNGKAMHDFGLSAKKLQLQGVKFMAKRNADTILNIGLEINTLSIPSFILDKFMSTLLLNSVAFEQCSRLYGNDITSYVVFMELLMKDREDALFVINEKIIENCFDANEEVYDFFKDVCEGVVFDLSKSYLAPVFRGLNAYTSKRHTGYWTDFRRK